MREVLILASGTGIPFREWFTWPMASFFFFFDFLKERLRGWTNLWVGVQMGVFGNGQQQFLIITRIWYQLSFLLGKLVFYYIFMDNHLSTARYSTDFFDSKHQVAVSNAFLGLITH